LELVEVGAVQDVRVVVKLDAEPVVLKKMVLVLVNVVVETIEVVVPEVRTTSNAVVDAKTNMRITRTPNAMFLESKEAVLGLRNENANPIAEKKMIKSGKGTPVKRSRADGQVTGCPTICAGQPLVVSPRSKRPPPKISPTTEKNRISRLLNFRLSSTRNRSNPSTLGPRQLRGSQCKCGHRLHS